MLGISAAEDMPVISWPVSIAGAVFAAWSIASARSASKRALPTRTRWVLVARVISLAFMGIAVAVVPWARSVGLVLGLVGVMGRAYFGIWALTLGGTKRQTS